MSNDIPDGYRIPESNESPSNEEWRRWHNRPEEADLPQYIKAAIEMVGYDIEQRDGSTTGQTWLYTNYEWPGDPRALAGCLPEALEEAKKLNLLHVLDRGSKSDIIHPVFEEQSLWDELGDSRGLADHPTHREARRMKERFNAKIEGTDSDKLREPEEVMRVARRKKPPEPYYEEPREWQIRDRYKEFSATVEAHSATDAIRKAVRDELYDFMAGYVFAIAPIQVLIDGEWVAYEVDAKWAMVSVHVERS